MHLLYRANSYNVVVGAVSRHKVDHVCSAKFLHAAPNRRGRVTPGQTSSRCTNLPDGRWLTQLTNRENAGIRITTNYEENGHRRRKARRDGVRSGHVHDRVLQKAHIWKLDRSVEGLRREIRRRFHRGAAHRAVWSQVAMNELTSTTLTKRVLKNARLDHVPRSVIIEANSTTVLGHDRQFERYELCR